MDLSNIVILDTETTGLDPERHEVWEIAYEVDGQENVIHLPVDISKADPMALKMNGFYERYPFEDFLEPSDKNRRSDTNLIRPDVRDLVANLRGKHILGAVPSFDDAFLKKTVRRYGFIETWHYHLIDIENLIV